MTTDRTSAAIPEWWSTSDLGRLAHAWDQNPRGKTLCGLSIRRSGRPSAANSERCRYCAKQVENGRSDHA